ncbi:NUDIX hydrolase [Nocardioides marinquilinus]|uniref:NUDIX hydrolase n=1 Tax=Nocardioides marinquilinus TaxID=1210400 RepID=A0ABP9Q6F5_9ACTN
MSLHGDALAVLEAWAPPDAAQAALRERYVGYLREHVDAMTRAGRPHHLTASTLVLSPDGAHVLLTLHAKAGRWFQFGGHCEPGDDTLAAAARREAEEESGLADLRLLPEPVQLSEHAVPFCADDGALVHHLDVRYAAVATPDGRHAVSDESLDVAWWPADALPDAELAPLVARAQSALASASSSGGGSMRAASDQPIR